MGTIDARQMAAAPRQQPPAKAPEAAPASLPEMNAAPAKTDTPAPTVPGGFGRLIFKAASPTTKVYGFDKSSPDRASKKLASVAVELRPGSGIYIAASVKQVAEKRPGQPNKNSVQFLFQASQFGGQCVKGETIEAQQDLAAFSAHVLREYADFRKNGPKQITIESVSFDDLANLDADTE